MPFTAPDIHPLVDVAMPPLSSVGLPGGVAMHIAPPTRADVTVLSVVLPGGNAEAPADSVASLAAALLREGSSRYPGEAIADALDFHGAWHSAYVTSHHTVVTLFALNHSLPQVLPVFLDMIYHPEFPESPLRARAASLAANIRVARGDVSFLSSCEADALIMGRNHPLARVEHPDCVRSVSRDVVMRFHQSRGGYQATCAVFAAGRLTPGVIRIISEAFARVAVHTPALRSSLSPLITPFTAAPEGERSIIAVPDAVQNAVTVVLPAPPRAHPHFLPLHIAVYSLGGYFTSRLMAVLREEHGLTYGVSASLHAVADGSCIRISTDVAPEATSRAVDIIADCMRSLSQHPLRADELDRVRQSLLAAQHTAADSPLAVLNHHVASVTSALPPGYFEAKQRAVLECSPQSIAEVADIYLRPSFMRVAIAGEKKVPPHY